MAADNSDDEFAAWRDPRLDPVGQLLRDTYDADNHDSLDPETMGLMLDLSRIEFDEIRQAAARDAETGGVGFLRAVLSMLIRQRRGE